MSATEKLNISADNPGLFFDEEASKASKVLLIAGAVSLVAAAGMGFAKGDHYSQFMHSYLVAFMFALSIALGTLFFTTLQHLTKAGWSVVVRRLSESIASAIPVMAILFLPIILPLLMGSSTLYIWSDHHLAETDHLIHLKQPYLNVMFFTIRCIGYFAFWAFLSRKLYKNSVAQDSSGDPELTRSLEKIAPFSMVLFGLTMTFAVLDWVMTLEPHWFSTMYGIYFFAGAFLTCMAVLILFARWLQFKGKLLGVVTVEHYHDMGKLLFGFTFFWGYIAFSQYMLIWYANMPEGTQWFLHRQEGGWLTLSLILLFGKLLIPFFGSGFKTRKTPPQDSYILGYLAAGFPVGRYVLPGNARPRLPRW